MGAGDEVDLSAVVVVWVDAVAWVTCAGFDSGGGGCGMTAVAVGVGISSVWVEAAL